jgi:hypothetical protein
MNQASILLKVNQGLIGLSWSTKAVPGLFQNTGKSTRQQA